MRHQLSHNHLTVQQPCRAHAFPQGMARSPALRWPHARHYNGYTLIWSRAQRRNGDCASPAYLARYGVPRSPEDLQRQEDRTIHFSTMLGARPFGWEYPDGDSYATLQLPDALHVNSAQTHEAAALAGLGLIQAPHLGIGRQLESGALVEIIPDFRRRALAVSLVVAHGRPHGGRRRRRVHRGSLHVRPVRRRGPLRS
jgi:hypothetical protein